MESSASSPLSRIHPNRHRAVAAYVRALGQIELIFTFIASVVFFREKINRLEFAGIILVGGGILILVLVG